jgi:putative hydrolase of the HAD superfamily
MIKAVTFDLDGVYFTENSFQDFKNNLPKKITDEVEVNRVLFKSDEILAFKRGELSEDQFWDFVRSSLGVTLNNDQIFQLLADNYQVNQNVVDTVKKVRKLGIKTCICTNNFPTRINALDQKFNFLSDFDVKVFSYQVNAVKPDPKILRALIDQSACDPSEIFYADDKQANVDSALSLGINAILYTDFNGFVAQLRKLGVAI